MKYSESKCSIRDADDIGMANSRSEHGTLTAGVVTTVNLDRAYPTVTVTFRNATGAAGTEIYFTTDGTTPSVAGAGTWVVPAVQGASKTARSLTSANTSALAQQGQVSGAQVQLISSAAVAYSVEGNG